MGENSAISWTDHTFNPWMGCTKVSPACQHCYAERDMDHRYGKVQWGPSGTRVLTSEANWKKPLKWNREAEKAGRPLRVFCASLADVFEDWPGPLTAIDGSQAGAMDGARQRLFNLIEDTPNLVWLLLTKRPENVRRFWSKRLRRGDINGAGAEVLEDVPQRFPNVWLGTTIENQAAADERIPHLLKCADLCGGTFLSCEPLLGPVDLQQACTLACANRTKYGVGCWPDSGRRWITDSCNGGFVEECICSRLNGIDWIIAGGESGPKARPSHPDWFRSLRDQAVAAGVPFHFKQWGEHLPWPEVRTEEQRQAWSEAVKAGRQSYFGACATQGVQGLKTFTTPGITPVGYARVGTKKAGRTLDGREWNEFPAAFGVEKEAV